MSKTADLALEKKIFKSLRGIVDKKMVSGLQIDAHGHVIIPILVDPAKGAELEGVRQDVEKTVSSISGVHKVTAILTAEKAAGDSSPPPKPRAQANDPHGMNKNPPVDVPAKNIIVVASGKGGVGKSTISANIAASLANTYGKKVGLLDADIYGPSQPVMMGDEAYKPQLNDKKQLIPAEKHGLKIMSIGFIADSTKALVWRGPMVQTAFYQMLRDVDWGTKDDPLDYLVIDLPPGTGDVQLTLAQKVKVSGAVIVTTPQDIALIDARRAVEMFEKTGVPVLGLVENMSTHICSNCGHEEHIFGHGGGEAEAKKLGIPFLGALPLSMDVRVHADQGNPIVLQEDAAESAAKLNEISRMLIDALG